MAQQVRVLIVDPHAAFRGACKALLQTEGLAVVADLERLDGAEDVATALDPDVVLIDVPPLETEGLELARRLSAVAQPPVIVLMSAAPSHAILATRAGADAFLPKAGITAAAIAQTIGIARSTPTPEGPRPAGAFSSLATAGAGGVRRGRESPRPSRHRGAPR